MAGFEGRGAARESTFDQWLAFIVEHLHIHVEVLFALLQIGLGDLLATGLIQLRPAFGQTIDRRMVVEHPRVLIEGFTEEQGQTHQHGEDQPEAGKDAPEQ